MSKPSRSAVISSLSTAGLPWENHNNPAAATEQQQRTEHERAPTKVRHVLMDS